MPKRAWRSDTIWEVALPYGEAADLGRRIGTSALVAQMLHNRGIADEQTGKAFLNPRLADLHDPQLLTGCEAAARRLAQAAKNRERIVLYGDYDVDGITGVAILHACLKMIGADVHYYIPHRMDEGYGVNPEAIAKILAHKVKVLVTVDCGISAAEALAQASAAGVDIIITDHHTPPDALPAALAVVHPALAGQYYPNPALSGAGVAFKLAWQLARHVCGASKVDEPLREFLLHATCLAALGTIADVVPLQGENRVLATYGLKGLPSATHPGLVALLESAGLTGEKVDAYHVGFMLAPRLNACGRMGHARLAVELLTEASPQRACEIAAFLVQQNAERQKVEKAIAEQAIQKVIDGKLDDPALRAIVLAAEDWHSGVIGIVASRLVERFGRPAVMISLKNGQGHGSCRSVAGFNMHDALSACAPYLIGFGGHAMAGGLRIEADKVPAFADALRGYAAERLVDQPLARPLRIDAEVTLGLLTYPTVQHLARLAPFGQGNPAPLVAVRSCKLMKPPRRMGRNGNAASLLLGQNGTSLRAVGFGMGDLADRLAGASVVDIAAEPMINTFNGSTHVELRLKDALWE